MRYGMTEQGEVWHMLVKDDKPLCECTLHTITHIFEGKEKPVPEKVCLNCDGKLRHKGAQERYRLKQEALRDKAGYRPRFSFRDWDR